MVKVSILLPVYNGETYLKEAIESILSQSFDDFELLILNDASTDNSKKIILAYQDKRIRYIENESNLGLVRTLNRGIELSTGEFIARMDQDDISTTDRIAKQCIFLDSNPDYIVVGSNLQIINGPRLNYPTIDKEIRVRLLISPAFAHPAVMIRKKIIIENKLYYKQEHKDAEDYGLWVSLTTLGKFYNLNLPLLNYRRHKTQYSVVFKNEMAATSNKIKTLYLDILNRNWDEQTKIIFLNSTDRNYTPSTIEELKKIKSVLENINILFEGSGLDMNGLEKLSKQLWRRVCVSYQQNGKSCYYQFLNSTLSTKVKFKTHLWFIKQNFINLLNKKNDV